MTEWLGTFLIKSSMRENMGKIKLMICIKYLPKLWNQKVWKCGYLQSNMKIAWKLLSQMQNEWNSREGDSEFSSMYSLKSKTAAENSCHPCEIYSAVSSSSFPTCPNFTPCYTLFLSSSSLILYSLHRIVSTSLLPLQPHSNHCFI